jgi:hypothetical protein
MGKNKVLQRRAARLMGTARRLSRESGETAHLHRETRYAAGTWDHRRRVIIKAEVVRHPGREPKDNLRFVVTNLKHSPRHLYEAIYCARGDIENRIKELHHGLQIDRTNRARPSECCRLCALPGVASAGRAHRLAIRSGQHPARTPHEARRLGAVLGAAHRVALAGPLACTATTGRSSGEVSAPRPHSAVSLVPRSIKCRLSHSGRMHA